MRTIADILTGLGGDTIVSRELDTPLTTVNSWKRKGYVPHWRIPGLIDLAARLGQSLSSADFPATRPTPEQAQEIAA